MMITRVLGRTVVDLDQLQKQDKNFVCVVQLATQPGGVLHTVTLRPDKINNGFIRLGDTPGDEAFGWQHPDNITVCAILGTAEIEGKETKVTPIAA